MNGGETPECGWARDNAAELALGVLPAQDRAALIAHLQRCPSCLEHVRELARTADELLGLIPGSEPPPGFETRVLRGIGLPPPGRRRRTLRQRLLQCAAATAAAAALVTGGWAIGTTSSVTEASGPAPTGSTVVRADRLLRADLIAQGQHAQGQDVGRVFAYTGPSPWLYMSVDADDLPPTTRAALHGGVTCQIERADGTRATVGTFALGSGYHHWAAPYPAGKAPVTGVRLLTADGAVAVTAAFQQPHAG
jgi:hypothetical protein